MIMRKSSLTPDFMRVSRYPPTKNPQTWASMIFGLASSTGNSGNLYPQGQPGSGKYLRTIEEVIHCAIRTAINNCEYGSRPLYNVQSFLSVSEPCVQSSNLPCTASMTLVSVGKYWSCRQSLRVSFQTRSIGFKSGL